VRRGLSALLAGALFAIGLVLGGMTQPAKIVGFLDFGGRWDPSLALFMGGALLVYGVLHRLITRRPAPLFEARFHLPTRRDVDRRLVGGAAIFGVGWGLTGYCPGPALTSVTTGSLPLIFVGAMAAGMYGRELLRRARAEGAPIDQ
jgi:uncharacterized protein